MRKLFRVVRILPPRARNALANTWVRLFGLESVFTRIYKSHVWKGQSVSGPGSDPAATARLQEVLPIWFADLGIRNLLDAPCGDFAWMQNVAPALERYIGADIVKPLVEANRREFGQGNVSFIHADIVSDALPKTDAVLCRDCLPHLSFDHIRAALRNFQRSGATWVLTTTYPGVGPNEAISSGRWRPLDLAEPPFNFPSPPKIIYETPDALHAQGDASAETLRLKALAAWRLQELDV